MPTLVFSLVTVMMAQRLRITEGNLGLPRGLKEVGSWVGRLGLWSGFGNARRRTEVQGRRMEEEDKTET